MGEGKEIGGRTEKSWDQNSFIPGNKIGRDLLLKNVLLIHRGGYF